MVLKVPQSLYRSHVMEASAALAGVILAVTFISVVSGRVAARRLTKSVAGLAEAPIQGISQQGISEIEGVRKKLEESAEARDMAVAKLQENEERLRIFVEHAPTALAMFDREMRYLAVSHRWMSDYRLADKDIIGRSHYEIFPEIPDRWKEAHRRCLEGQIVRTDEDRFERAEGSVQWHRWEVRPWHDFSGTIGGVIIFTEDITERKKMEEDLRESEERLKFALEGSREGFWDWNLETGEVHRNERWAEMLGYSFKDIAFNVPQWADLVHPEDKNRAWKSIKDHLEGHNLEHVCEYRMLTKDGSWKWILDHARVIKRDDHGKPLRMAGTHTDITERKKAEEVLKQSEIRYRNLFENMSEGVAVYKAEQDGKDFIFVDFNAAAERIDKKDRREIIGQSILDAFPGVTEFGLFETIQRVWLTGEPQRLPIAHYKDDSIQGWRDNFVYKLPSGEVVVAYSDETERQRAEEALRLSEEKFRLIAETIEDVFWITTPDLQITKYVSPGFEKIWGRTQESLYESPKSFMESVHQEDREQLVKAIEDHVNSQWACEYRIVRPDGSIRWIHDRGYPILNENGDLVLRTGVASDITERKEAEDLLKVSEERSRFLASVVELSAQPFAAGYPDGSLGIFNKAYCDLLGYTEEEMRRLDWNNDLTPPEYSKMQASKIEELLRTDKPVRYEKEYIHKDGSRVPVELLVHVVRGEDGRPLHFYAFVTDLTDRKRSEEALRQSERDKSLILESAAELFTYYDLDLRVRWANKASADSVGQKPEALVGRH